MALTPVEDKMAIKAILDNDTVLINDLGFLPTDILLYDEVEQEVTGDTRYIFIVNYPSPPSYKGFTVEVEYGIEVVVPKRLQGTALRAIQRAIELLNDVNIGNVHILEIKSGITQLTAPKETVRYGTSVGFATSIQSSNKLGKII